MQNPFQKNKLEIIEKREKKNILKEILIIVVLLILAVGITISLIYLEIKIKESTSEVEIAQDQTLDETDSGERFWFIEKIVPTGSTFRVELSSNAGNVRTYNDLISFGLSQSREYFAVNTGSKINIIKLIDETVVSAQIPAQKYSGSIGQSIQWDSKNENFGMNVYTDDNIKASSVWIFGKNGNLLKEIKTNLIINELNNSIDSPQFSLVKDQILVSTYKEIDSQDTKEDGGLYKISELPIYLTVFDYSGNTIKELMVRDYDINSNKIYYSWDKKNSDTIDYYLYSEKVEFNPNQDYLFTKVKI